MVGVPAGEAREPETSEGKHVSQRIQIEEGVSTPVPPSSDPSIEGPELAATYFTDPLCDPLNDVERPLHLGALSRQASEIGGVPIADRIWVEDPPASSYPACIAVKAAEVQSLEAGDLYLRRVREALVAQGRNVARRQVLLAVAAELARDRPDALSLTRFEHDLESAAARKAFGSDLNTARDAGVERFPTLVLRRPGGEVRTIVGYRPYDALLEAVGQFAQG